MLSGAAHRIHRSLISHIFVFVFYSKFGMVAKYYRHTYYGYSCAMVVADDDIHIRRARVTDLDAIWNIQRVCYETDLVESRETFENILGRGSNVSFVAYGDDDVIVGYLLAHPWSDILNPPELHNLNLEEMRPSPWGNNVYYIHDVTVLVDYRGSGVGKALVNMFMDRVNSPEPDEIRPIVTLVSVGDSQQFWIKQGFHQVACCAAILNTYQDPSASYMILH